MAKIWRNRIEGRTQLFSECPERYKKDVLDLMIQDVADGIITEDVFFELTNMIYKEIKG